nr:hypothetical protein [Tanacetum cinerariifolium]
MVESEKAKAIEEPEEQNVPPVRSRGRKGYMRSGENEANVPKLFKKNDVPRKTRTLIVAEEPSTVAIAKKLKEIIQKDELIIADLEGVGDVSKPRSFECHMSKSSKPYPSFYNNDFYYLFYLSTEEKYTTSLTKHYAARYHIQGHDWNDKDVKRSKEMVNKIEKSRSAMNSYVALKSMLEDVPRLLILVFFSMETSKQKAQKLYSRRFNRLNMSDLDTMSLDDLYNHLKVYESEVHKKLEPNSQNMAFISSIKHSSGNKVGNTACVPTTSTNVPIASASVSTISQDTACAYIASQSSGSQIKFKDINQFDEDDVKEMDIKWNMALLSMRADKALKNQDRGRRDNYRQGSKAEEHAPKALMAIDGVGWDWSYMENNEEDHALVADEVAPIEFALMANTSAESKVFDNSLFSKDCKKNNDSLHSKITDLTDKLLDANNLIYHYKLALAQVESRLVEYKEREVKYSKKIKTLEFYNESNNECIEILKNKLETLKEEKEGVDGKLAGLLKASKDLDNLIESQRPSPTVETTSGDDQNRNPYVSETVASPITPKPFIQFVKPKDSQSKSKSGKTKSPKKPPVKKRVRNSFTPKPIAHRPYRPSQRPVKTNMHGASPNRTSFNKQAHSYANRPFHKTSTVRSPHRAPWVPTVNRNFPPVNRKFSPGSRNFPTANRKFPTGSTNCSTVDMRMKGKAGSSQNKIDDKGYWDSGCSRHMIGNISYLPDYEPFDGGYVSFGQGGCKITGKGTIKIECIVLGRDFKLLDDANILLRTPRQHNMYSIDLNNIVPHKDLTCFVAKASADECILWHRRICHLNFEIMNKLVMHNLVRVNKSHNKTSYELFNGRSHAIGFLKPFGCHVVILNTLDNLGKFEEKGDEGCFIGYSMSSKAFRVFNKRTRRVEENFHVEFLENKAIEKGVGPNWLFDIDSLTKSINYVPVDAGTISTNLSGTKDVASQEVKKNVSSLRYIAFPNWAHDALLEFSLTDQIEILTMETPIPTVSLPVPTAYSTDSQEPSSDARLISKRVANQVETPSLDNISSLTNRNKSKEVKEQSFIATIHRKTDPTLLQFCPFLCFLSQVEPKKISDALQDPSWVLKNKKYERGIVIKNKARLVAQGHNQEEGIDYDKVFAPVARIKAIRLFLAYASFIGFTVYQIDVKCAFLYGTIDEELCREFEALMHEKFQMSVMGELNFFLGLQVLQRKDGIFLSQDKYVGDILKKFGYSEVRSSNTLMDKENPWGKDGTGKDDRKSTTRGCQFFGRRLISWQCKKQTLMATSTTEAEYVAAASCCGQVLWIQNQLLDYGDCFEKKLINVDHIHTDENVADLLTKPFDAGRFQYLVGEGSGTPTEPHHTPSPEAQSPSHTTHTSPTLPPVTTTSLPTVTQSDTPIARKYTMRTRIAQSSVLSTDRATIDKSSTLPHDSAPWVTSPVAGEGTQEVEINRLKERVKMLEDREGVAATRSKDDAPIKGRSMDEGEEATERISDDSKEMATVLTFMDAATVLASRVVDVPTSSGSIPTASTPTEEQVPTGSDVVPTASPVFTTTTVVTPYRKRKGKEVMVESETLKKQKVQEQIDAQVAKELEEQLEREDQRRSEQIARDAEIARIHAEEELQSQQRKPMTKKQKRDYYIVVIRNNLGWKVKDFRGKTFKDVEAKFNSVWKKMEDFIPMGLKEKAKRIKRKGLNLEQKSAKKQKTSKEVPKEAMSPKEVLKEKVKEMMQLVPIEEVYVEALQVNHPIIDWKVYTEGQRSYWKITRLGGSLASYQFFIDLLKHLDREDLNQLWRLVKETLSNRPPTSDKEMEL